MKLRQLSPVARFSISSLVVLTLLAVAIGNIMADRIQERALGHAVRAAQVVGSLGVRAAIPEQELRDAVRPLPERSSGVG